MNLQAEIVKFSTVLQEPIHSINCLITKADWQSCTIGSTVYTGFYCVIFDRKFDTPVKIESYCFQQLPNPRKVNNKMCPLLKNHTTEIPNIILVQ